MHREEFIYLPELRHDSAIIAWGAFYFRDLTRRPVPAADTIGLKSLPYTKKGELACVELFDESNHLLNQHFTEQENSVPICDLTPDTVYRYRLTLQGGEWPQLPLLDWEPNVGLVEKGNVYTNQFRTFPASQDRSPFCFGVIGDFGVGIKKGNRRKKCQWETSRALQKAVHDFQLRFLVTTGDNIYHEGGRSGDVDDHWYFTYFQPYRYFINQIPVFPCMGNHDTAETKFESSDDRKEIYDNFYIRSRFQKEENSLDPGLFYSFRYGGTTEFICLDTSKNTWPIGKRMFQVKQHEKFLATQFSPRSQSSWRISFEHHPPFSAGPEHFKWENSVQRMLVPLWERSGVSVVFSGHEHNFQYSEGNGVHYFITGAGGKFAKDPPHRLEKVHTLSWGGNEECHFLVVRIDGNQMEIWPVSGLTEAGELRFLKLHGEKTDIPIRINRSTSVT